MRNIAEVNVIANRGAKSHSGALGSAGADRTKKINRVKRNFFFANITFFPVVPAFHAFNIMRQVFILCLKKLNHPTAILSCLIIHALTFN